MSLPRDLVEMFTAFAAEGVRCAVGRPQDLRDVRSLERAAELKPRKTTTKRPKSLKVPSRKRS
jgi:hypothetical protein